eukprot:scaffold10007_cov24-Tisochrysis_lutea.AAC.3
MYERGTAGGRPQFPPQDCAGEATQVVQARAKHSLLKPALLAPTHHSLCLALSQSRQLQVLCTVIWQGGGSPYRLKDALLLLGRQGGVQGQHLDGSNLYAK